MSPLKTHISYITHSSYFYITHLRVAACSVSSSVFALLVHAFICSQVDYCNSHLIGLPKVCFWPLQAVLNVVAKSMAHYSYLSTFMLEQLHWLPLSACIKFNIIILVFKAQ